jgi:hypothetical protein
MDGSCEHCKGKFQKAPHHHRERFCSDLCAAKHAHAKGILEHMSPEHRDYVHHLLRGGQPYQHKAL